MKRYVEVQKFPNVWLWLLLAIAIVNGFILLNVITKHMIVGIVGISIPLLGLLVLWSLELKVEIDEKRILYSFYPLIRERVILWDDVIKFEIRQYDPISEYGGWGIRYSKRNGKAYTVKGDIGLQLYLKDNKQILLGVSKTEELKAVIFN